MASWTMIRLVSTTPSRPPGALASSAKSVSGSSPVIAQWHPATDPDRTASRPPSSSQVSTPRRWTVAVVMRRPGSAASRATSRRTSTGASHGTSTIGWSAAGWAATMMLPVTSSAWRTSWEGAPSSSR